ncbi:unnamed protein product [Adineta steineri]|uniref:G-protein coupled receptors family 1 profile domain-containing protein n=1 Tax=Adineta steineri TaxID=433720 RepID=A0A819N8J5_9BILA|nr:unnamed protein product [Adineta steineri]CAF3991954.1 unnamed protein product [Adineta steineri]
MIVSLLFGLLPNIYSGYYVNLITTVYSICKIRFYITQSSTMTYRWFLTIACIDRYAQSSVNVRLRAFAKSHIAYRIVICVTIIWIVLPIHNLIYRITSGSQCTWLSVTSALYNSFFTIILGNLTPPLIMIICAILIDHNLAFKRERRRKNNQSQIEDESVRILQVRDYQAIAMLFIQVIFYITSTLPWVVFTVYSAFTLNVDNKSNDRQAIEGFLGYISEMILNIFPMMSFYLYTLTSNMFRQQFIKTVYPILTFKNRCWSHPQRIEPINQ